MNLNILALSNFIPEEIIDVKRFESYKGNIRIENFCTYAQNFVSRVIEDDSVDGAVVPNSCDSIRMAADYIRENTGKFVYQIKHPLIFSSESILEYADEIIKYKSSIEKHFNISISREFMQDRIEKLDKKYLFIKGMYDSLNSISYYDYIKALNKSFTEPLNNWEDIFRTEYRKTDNSVKVFIIGPFLSDISIIQKIEEFGGNIVGDDLTNSKRYFSIKALNSNVDESNIFINTAYRNLSRHPSPTLNNFREVVSRDMHEIKKKEVRKVIFIYQKFCEPHDYIYPLFKEILDEEGIESLRIQLENGINSENIEMRLETFLNM